MPFENVDSFYAKISEVTKCHDYEVGQQSHFNLRKAHIAAAYNLLGSQSNPDDDLTIALEEKVKALEKDHYFWEAALILVVLAKKEFEKNLLKKNKAHYSAFIRFNERAAALFSKHLFFASSHVLELLNDNVKTNKGASLTSDQFNQALKKALYVCYEECQERVLTDFNVNEKAADFSELGNLYRELKLGLNAGKTPKDLRPQINNFLRIVDQFREKLNISLPFLRYFNIKLDVFLNVIRQKAQSISDRGQAFDSKRAQIVGLLKIYSKLNMLKSKALGYGQYYNERDIMSRFEGCDYLCDKNAIVTKIEEIGSYISIMLDQAKSEFIRNKENNAQTDRVEDAKQLIMQYRHDDLDAQMNLAKQKLIEYKNGLFKQRQKLIARQNELLENARETDQQIIKWNAQCGSDVDSMIPPILEQEHPKKMKLERLPESMGGEKSHSLRIQPPELIQDKETIVNEIVELNSKLIHFNGKPYVEDDKIAIIPLHEGYQYLIFDEGELQALQHQHLSKIANKEVATSEQDKNQLDDDAQVLCVLHSDDEMDDTDCMVNEPCAVAGFLSANPVQQNKYTMFSASHEPIASKPADDGNKASKSNSVSRMPESGAVTGRAVYDDVERGAKSPSSGKDQDPSLWCPYFCPCPIQ